ncbi:MAG: BolA/IbaG family iron-sulfur metabolism protein, partial [Gammaproteobacteria bacterium]
MKKEDIIRRVKGLYPDAIIDLAGADCSFEMYVISDVFDGMNTLQSQQPILALFKGELASGKLHALSVKAKTPKEQSG